MMTLSLNFLQFANQVISGRKMRLLAALAVLAIVGLVIVGSATAECQTLDC